MLHLVVKNDAARSGALRCRRKPDHLRLVVSRSEQGIRIEPPDLANRLATEWRASFLPAAGQASPGGSRVIQLFERPNRLLLLPAADLDHQLLMD